METMRNYFYILFLLLGFTSCDDGDIIINNFDFEETNIKGCDKDGKPKVFYKINTNDVFESISLVTNNASISSLPNILSTTTDPISFNLDDNNKINYRVYDGTVTRDYFCNTLPPSTPKVIQEFISVGGTVVITTEESYPDAEDSDGDGIADIDEEEGDTDDDGIENKFDIDDDGDNVPTKNETATANDDPETPEGYRDTDGDGKPNYLDPDDDGDEVDTKEEVLEADQAPINAANFTDGVANYLNKAVSNRFMGEVTFVIENEILAKFRSVISIKNLQLQNQDGSGEVISFETYELGEFNSTSTLITIDSTPTTTEEN